MLWRRWEIWKPTRWLREGFLKEEVWGNDNAVTATVACVHLSAPRGRCEPYSKSGLAPDLLKWGFIIVI